MARPQLTRADAAAERALKYRELADRPRERSASVESGAPRLWTPAVRSACTIERAAAGSKAPVSARFEGYASVTGKPYVMYDWLGPYDEIVAVGAFEETLAREDLHVPLVLDHVSSRRIALLSNPVNPFSPLELSEVTDGETTGLRSVAPSLDLTESDTAYIVKKMDLQLIDEMSFRFSIDEGRWSEDFTTFTIRKVNIHRGDVSIVGYGANPMTTGAGMRAMTDEDRAARDRAAALSMIDDNRFDDLSRRLAG